MNPAILASKAKTRQFTESEFLTGLGILIGAAEFAQRGCDLFSVKDSGEEDEKSTCHSTGGKSLSASFRP